ncbi:MAG TPA: hypothetical protein PK997_04945 [Candidatus Omnitrophota bacterium]|nr:MAG: hypothetical protein BWY49_00426 [Candidatus Omnitrophica bacterium ADurb.Bin314]HQB94542.1 hypothetical protein [Candidatus Omnitrophota bacterium]
MKKKNRSQLVRQEIPGLRKPVGKQHMLLHGILYHGPHDQMFPTEELQDMLFRKHCEKNPRLQEQRRSSLLSR